MSNAVFLISERIVIHVCSGDPSAHENNVESNPSSSVTKFNALAQLALGKLHLVRQSLVLNDSLIAADLLGQFLT